MRTRLFPFAAFLALIMAWPAVADEKKADEKKKDDKPAKPTLVVRISSLDTVLTDARYLAKLAGKGSEAEQAEAMLKAMSGEKGLKGLDTTRPIGLYGYLGPNGIDSQAVLLLPIADEKAFLSMLESFNLKPEKEDGGVYKINVEKIIFPIYFRFADKYLYATVRDQEAIEKDRLLVPGEVLKGDGVASIVLNIDEIPRELKEIALGQSELQFANAKEKDVPGETKAQKEFRLAFLDEVDTWFKELLNGGDALALQLDIDRKDGNLTLTANLAGKPDSKLAQSLAGLNKQTSVTAITTASRDVAVSLQLDAELPAKLRSALAPVIEEGFQQALEKEKDEAKRKLAEPLLKVIAPTAKMGQLDASLSMQGPNSDGLYTLLMSGKIKDGKALEQAFKDAVKESPVKVKGSLSIDFAKVGDVNIHKAIPDKVDEKTRNTLGDNPIYFAFRDNSLIAAAGPGALDAIKSAVVATATPAKLVQIDMAMARMAKLIASEGKAHKQAPVIAEKVFKGNGDDTMQVSLEGGKTLQLKLSFKTQLVKFFTKLGEANKGAMLDSAQ